MDDRTAHAKTWLQKFYPTAWKHEASVNIRLLPKELTLFADLETARLEAENKRLREGLEHYADEDNWGDLETHCGDLDENMVWCGDGVNGYDHARNMLNGDIEREEK